VSALRPLLRPARRAWIGRRTGAWARHSHLFLSQHSPGWAPAEDARALGRIAERLGIALGPPEWAGHVRGQCVFHLSQFALTRAPWPPANRTATVFFHGRPGTPGYPEFDELWGAFRERHTELHRVQVSHRELHELVLETGIEPGKVFRIPIGVDTDVFVPAADPEARQSVRDETRVPREAFVVGSFQKDGVGWGTGAEPKTIKGPDVLLAALERLRAVVPDLFVVLTGPARGYVRAGLERLGIPHRHFSVFHYDSLPAYYALLDAYVIPARQEGGPKALLEAMACGVPVVSTRVGQAADLVRHGENGWLADVDDAEELAHWLAHVRHADASAVVTAGRHTAEANSYEAQVPLWRDFFTGFVER
jgi:glycosyltransferase involved in cell wall biosynthesis